MRKKYDSYKKSVKSTNPSATIVTIVPAIIPKIFFPLNGFVYSFCMN